MKVARKLYSTVFGQTRLRPPNCSYCMRVWASPYAVNASIF